jgi:hypothetical protein
MPCIGLLPLFRRPNRGLLFLRIPSPMTLNLFLLNSIPTSPIEIVCGFGFEGENWNFEGGRGSEISKLGAKRILKKTTPFDATASSIS